MHVFQALVGLSRCDTVKQIVSKLPLFNSAQLQRRLCFLYCLHSVFFLLFALHLDVCIILVKVIVGLWKVLDLFIGKIYCCWTP